VQGNGADGRGASQRSRPAGHDQRNTTVLDSRLRSIDLDAADELHKATREYNRAIEEIAMLEQQVKVRSRGFLRRIFG